MSVAPLFPDPEDDWAALSSERLLVAAAIALGARTVPGWSDAEEQLTRSLPELPKALVSDLRQQVAAGLDPLGQRFCTLRVPADRRSLGATYTPPEIINAMCAWAVDNGRPARIVDPGTGSGRFLLRSARTFPHAHLIGVEIDPVAAILARGNLAAAGLAKRSQVLLTDYRSLALPEIEGKTLYIGNPPYVRHHLLEPRWKEWLAREATSRGYRSSQLAGLHTYFLLATAIHGKEGDYGSFITAAEWLDVNYGRLIRDLVLDRLGGQSIILIEPTAAPFSDAQTTAAILNFRIDTTPPAFRFHRVKDLPGLKRLGKGRIVRRERLEVEQRWSHLTRSAAGMSEGHVELGELFRVHRGQVTGANKIWIAGEHSRSLPEAVLFATVTRARELLAAGPILTDPNPLRRVIDLPEDLSLFDEQERISIDRFLKRAKAAGADQGYVARNRRAWWSVGLREPAPILATYMARRPPAFVRNLALARHINIAHGLYPREPLSEAFLSCVIKHLSTTTSVLQGRTYAGGLTKFEPREMERIPIPSPELAAQLSA